jgi:HK97 family phage prohead protease
VDVPELKSQRHGPAKGKFNVQIKALAEDGSFEGKLAVYSKVDLGGDNILPGAFTKTIQERGDKVPLLWQHNSDEPIGVLTLVDGPDALSVKGQLLMELDQAKRAYLLLKAGVIKGLSIGFDTIKDSVENGVRQLKELRLWEGSIVTFPMNEAAMVTSIKRLGNGAQPGETKDDFNTELAELQLRDAGYQIMSALSCALYSVNWATGMSREEKIAAAETIIEQFQEAYMAYFPQYLDWMTEEYGDMERMSQLKREQKAFSQMLVRGAKTIAIAHAMESKEGRKFSADSMKSLKEAHGHVKDLDDIFNALFDSEADDDPEDPADDSGDDTLKSTAALQTKSEPAESHSAAEAQILEIRSLIPKE